MTLMTPSWCTVCLSDNRVKFPMELVPENAVGEADELVVVAEEVTEGSQSQGMMDRCRRIAQILTVCVCES